MWLARLTLILGVTLRLLIVAENLIDIYKREQQKGLPPKNAKPKRIRPPRDRL